MLLSSCLGGPKPLKNPELACQTISCICTANETELFQETATTKVLWKSNGDAYCPDGFHLERKDQ